MTTNKQDIVKKCDKLLDLYQGVIYELDDLIGLLDDETTDEKSSLFIQSIKDFISDCILSKQYLAKIANYHEDKIKQ